jgi:hypothetical protein
MRTLADHLLAHQLPHHIDHSDWEKDLLHARRAHSQKPCLHKGRSPVSLTWLGGTQLPLCVRTLRHDKTTSRRSHAKRRRGASLAYQAIPALQALGCFQGLLPALWQKCV